MSLPGLLPGGRPALGSCGGRRPAARHRPVPRRRGRRGRGDRAGDRDPRPRRLPLRPPRAGRRHRGADRVRRRRAGRVPHRPARRRRTPLARRGRARDPAHAGPHAGVDLHRRPRRASRSRTACSPATRCSSATSAAPTSSVPRAGPPTTSPGPSTAPPARSCSRCPTPRACSPRTAPGSACGKNLSTETSSTIGEQRRTNYALAPMSEDAFVAAVCEGPVDGAARTSPTPRRPTGGRTRSSTRRARSPCWPTCRTAPS